MTWGVTLGFQRKNLADVITALKSLREELRVVVS